MHDNGNVARHSRPHARPVTRHRREMTGFRSRSNQSIVFWYDAFLIMCNSCATMEMSLDTIARAHAPPLGIAGKQLDSDRDPTRTQPRFDWTLIAIEFRPDCDWNMANLLSQFGRIPAIIRSDSSQNLTDLLSWPLAAIDRPESDRGPVGLQVQPDCGRITIGFRSNSDRIATEF